MRQLVTWSLVAVLWVVVFLLVSGQWTLPVLTSLAGMAETELRMWSVFRVVAFFGAFGGVLAGLSEVPIRRLREEGLDVLGGRKTFWVCLLISALQGIGGAISFAGLAALGGRITDWSESTRLLFGFLSVATGFAGRKFLLLVSKSLLTREIEDEVERTAGKVKELTLSSKRKEVLDEALNSLEIAINTPPGKEGETTHLFETIAKEALRKAEAAIQYFPSHRRLGIMLGRLKDRWKGPEKAVEWLTRFITARCREGLDRDGDHAALLYNRACYRNKFAEALEGDGAESLRNLAWTDLKQSCVLDKLNVEEAVTDPDLKTLFNAQRLQADLER